MFKAVNNLREQKGFTLIELLIVVAIIGILAAIAIPAFLGQREKSKLRCVVASAKGSVAEVQSILDAYVGGEAFLLLDANQNEVCYQSDNPEPTKTCDVMFGEPITGTYGWGQLVQVTDWIVAHHNDGKGERSCYVGTQPLFVRLNGVGGVPGVQGQVGIINTGARTFVIKGWGERLGANQAVFETTVTSR